MIYNSEAAPTVHRARSPAKMKRSFVIAALCARVASGADPAAIVDLPTSIAPSGKEWQFDVRAFSVEHPARLRLLAPIASTPPDGSHHRLPAADRRLPPDVAVGDSDGVEEESRLL